MIAAAATTRRRTPLARANLLQSPVRTAVSILGISLAIVLMFMQLGFLGSIDRTASLIFDATDADLILQSADYLHVFDAGTIDDSVWQSVDGLPGVVATAALDLGVTQWQTDGGTESRPIAVLGVNPEKPPIEIQSNAAWSTLRSSGHVWVDDASREDYGPLAKGTFWQSGRFGAADIGRTAELGGRPVRIAGTYTLGTGLAANGAVLTSRSTFSQVTVGRRHPSTSMALVWLSPSVSRQHAIVQIHDRLRSLAGAGSLVRVVTPEQAKAAEGRRWARQTPIGLIFWMGTALAMVVGAVIASMVLSSDVASHLPEYATLRAMGYSNTYLVKTLLAQATWLALLSLPPATAAALGLYRMTQWASGLPIEMQPWIVGLVWTLSIVMCNVAGVLAIRKLLSAEPAAPF